MSWLQPLWLAMALLTTLPMGRLIQPPVTPEDQGHSVACYPLVGAVIGGLLVLLAWLLPAEPSVLVAVLLLAAWVALTGALHLDGLADCSDAWAAGHAGTRRTLEVMKDPACGPIAVSVLVLVLLLKLGALLALGAQASGLLLAAPVLARAGAAVFMMTTDYRRSGGIAADQSGHLPVIPASVIIAVLALVGLLLLPPALWALVIVATGLCVLFWRSAWQRLIGGYTGDTVGGLIEVIEVVVLLCGALAA